MAEHDHKHEHGKMDIETQEKTFEGFIRLSSYAAIASVLFLVFLGLVNG